jgi:Ca2+:H+ antiporter
MASNDQGSSGQAKDIVSSPLSMSNPPSPTDTRHPLSKPESTAEQRDGPGGSLQSTDTVRRRPEPLSYGTNEFLRSAKQ